MLSGAPSPEEGAAKAAALEQFLADTAPAPAPAAQTASRWQRAGLLEGVGREPRAVRWGPQP
jgi:hypothetical protein